jgi:hypothetical protein
MNTTETAALDDATPLDERAHRTARTRQSLVALAMSLAPWGFVIANASYAWNTRHGGEDISGTGALAMAAHNPNADRLFTTIAMIASILMVPTAIGAMRLTQRKAARLGTIGGVVVAGAYICYFAMLSADRFTLVLAARGPDNPDYVAILDQSLQGVTVVWFYVFFALGNIVGTFILGLALLRSRSIPRWAAWFVMAWGILHVVGLMVGTEWIEVGGAIVQAVGFATAGMVLRRRPIDGTSAMAASAIGVSASDVVAQPTADQPTADQSPAPSALPV